MPPRGKEFADSWSKPAQGNRSFGHTKVTVSFDHDTFDEIRDRALDAHTSFAEQVRLLCEWGLEASLSNSQDASIRQRHVKNGRKAPLTVPDNRRSQRSK